MSGRARVAVPAAAPVTVMLGSSMAAGGDALGRLGDGRVVFVEGGLPGEEVTAAVVDERRDFARARVVSVSSGSPDRVEPPCRWAAAGCGGCQWQHVAPHAQLAYKVEVLADSLRRIAGMDMPPGPAPAAVAPGGYRTTLHTAVDAEGRPALHRRHSRDLVTPDHCLVAHPSLDDLVTRTRLRPGVGAVTFRVGVAGGERLVLPEAGAVVVEAPVDAVVAVPGRSSAEVAVLHEEAGGRRWRVSAGSFFQSGPAAADLLAATVDAAVGPLDASDVLVDLYAGVGLLGGVTAARCGGDLAGLVAVESAAGAAADASSNLADLGVGVEVVTAEVGAWEPVAADVVVADPARPGLGKPGVAAVVATGARRVVLVSCDPASAARDAALLGAAEYRLVEVAVLDLFAHTFHLESVGTFVRP